MISGRAISANHNTHTPTIRLPNSQSLRQLQSLHRHHLFTSTTTAYPLPTLPSPQPLYPLTSPRSLRLGSHCVDDDHFSTVTQIAKLEI
ncbi:hypothetical protein E2C01_090324 [Portunus trituberculatus]|uniref:Uncharacterized protein n=1 Tax=Portunus trituberculatus TaxID=210409 RepID=A0A5B7JQ03_PORTR|nr:hypothetical protein [Portunus trituberculatus]